MRKRLLIFAFLTVLVPSALAQDEHPGMLLFKQGKHAEAISSLKDAVRSREYEYDPEMWNALGMGYFAKGDFSDSGKSLEKAVKLAPQNPAYRVNLAYAYLRQGELTKADASARAAAKLAPANPVANYILGVVALMNSKIEVADEYAEKTISYGKDLSLGYLLAAQIQTAKFSQVFIEDLRGREAGRQNVDILIKSQEFLNQALSRSRKEDKQLVERELSSVTAFIKYFLRDPFASLSSPGNPTTVVPIKVISKPQAVYSDEARRRRVEGTIRAVVLCGASGRVEGVILLKRLGFGLDEAAIRAATQIRFEPRTHDGKPVASVVTLEYGFHTY